MVIRLPIGKKDDDPLYVFSICTLSFIRFAPIHQGFRMIHSIIRRGRTSRVQSIDLALSLRFIGAGICFIVADDLRIVINILTIPVGIIAYPLRFIPCKFYDRDPTLFTGIRSLVIFFCRPVDKTVYRIFQCGYFIVVIHTARHVQYQYNIKRY